MSRSKGGKYELKFARKVQDRGLPAQKVPLSGAMQGYPGDVIVCDEWIVECKYKTRGDSFKQLYQWMSRSEYPVLTVFGADVSLVVFTLDAWCEEMHRRINDDTETQYIATPVTSSSSFTQLRKWIQECHWLAVRMPREEWLVIDIREGA